MQIKFLEKYPMLNGVVRESDQKCWRPIVYLMMTCFVALVLLTYLRYYFYGTLTLDGLTGRVLPDILIKGLFFLSMGGAGICFLKMLSINIDSSEMKNLFVFSVILQFIVAFSLPLTSNDMFSNLAYGHMMQRGINVQSFGPAALPLTDPFRMMVTPRWMDTPMVYGPIVGWFNQMTVVSESLVQSILAYKCATMIPSLGIVILAYLFSKKTNSQDPGSFQSSRSFVLLAFNPLILWELPGQAHNDVILVLSAMAFVYMAYESRVFLAILSMCLGIFSKVAMLPVLGLYLCFLFFDNRKRFILWSLLILVSAALFFYFFSQKMGMIFAFPFMGKIDPSRLSSSIAYLIFFGMELFDKEYQLVGYRLFWVVSLAFMAQLGVRFAVRSRALNQVFLYSLLFLLFFILIFIPNYQVWYLSWLVPFAMTLENNKLQKYVAVFCVISMFFYPLMMGGLPYALINIVALIVLWRKVFSPLSLKFKSPMGEAI